jgi:hypothetical protein
LGSDEFLILLRHADSATCSAISDRLIGAMADDVSSRELSATVVFATAPEDGWTVEELLQVVRKRPNTASLIRSNEPPESPKLIH